MKRAFAILGTIILMGIIIIILLKDVIYRKYKNSDFGINTYVSKYDKDNDGIDDQTDILNNVKKYISQIWCLYGCYWILIKKCWI